MRSYKHCPYIPICRSTKGTSYSVRCSGLRLPAEGDEARCGISSIDFSHKVADVMVGLEVGQSPDIVDTGDGDGDFDVVAYSLGACYCGDTVESKEEKSKENIEKHHKGNGKSG